MIPPVAASERGRAQTSVLACWGSDCIIDLNRVIERSWKDLPERVKAPYMKPDEARQNPEYHETRETLWECAGTTP